jgi:hypothetical protein
MSARKRERPRLRDKIKRQARRAILCATLMVGSIMGANCGESPAPRTDAAPDSISMPDSRPTDAGVPDACIPKEINFVCTNSLLDSGILEPGEFFEFSGYKLVLDDVEEKSGDAIFSLTDSCGAELKKFTLSENSSLYIKFLQGGILVSVKDTASGSKEKWADAKVEDLCNPPKDGGVVVPKDSSVDSKQVPDSAPDMMPDAGVDAMPADIGVDSTPAVDATIDSASDLSSAEIGPTDSSADACVANNSALMCNQWALYYSWITLGKTIDIFGSDKLTTVFKLRLDKIETASGVTSVNVSILDSCGAVVLKDKLEVNNPKKLNVAGKTIVVECYDAVISSGDGGVKNGSALIEITVPCPTTDGGIGSG